MYAHGVNGGGAIGSRLKRSALQTVMNGMPSSSRRLHLIDEQRLHPCGAYRVRQIATDHHRRPRDGADGETQRGESLEASKLGERRAE